MSLYLPPPVRPIAWVAGSSWPDGDEDKMWAVSRAWEQASKDLAAQVSGIESAKTAAMAAFPAGDAADQIGRLFDAFLQGDQSLATLAESFKTISDSTFDVGTELQSAKINIIVSLCILLVEIAWAWLFPPTAPAVEAAAIGTTRSIVKYIADALQNALERAWAKLGFATRGELNGASRYWFKHILSADTWKGMKGQTWKYKAKTILPTAKGMGVYTLKFGEGALWAPVTNAIVQGAQIADGKRHGFNWKEFGASWAASALSTIPSRELGRYMGFGIGNLDKKFGGAITNMPFRSGMFLQGATIGATAGVFGNIFGNLGAGAVTGDIAGAFAGPEGWVGSAARGGMVGGMRGLGTKTTTDTEGDPRFNLWMNAKAPWAPPKTPPTNNPLTPRPVPGQTGASSTTHPGGTTNTATTNTGGNHQQGGGFRDPSDPNYMTPSRPAPQPPVNGGRGGGGFRSPSDPNYMVPSRPAPAPPTHPAATGGQSGASGTPSGPAGSGGQHQPTSTVGGGFRAPSDPNYMTPSRPAPQPPVNGGHGGGGFRDPSNPNYMTPSRPAPQPPVNGAQGGGGFRSPSDPNYMVPSRPAPAPPVGGGDGSAPHPAGSSANAAPGSRPAPTINAAPGGNSNNPPNFSRPFTHPGATAGGPVSSSSAPSHAAPVGNSTGHPSSPPNFSRPFTQPGASVVGPVSSSFAPGHAAPVGNSTGNANNPPNFSRPFTQQGPPTVAVPNSSAGGQTGGGFRDPSDPNYMAPSRPAPAPPVNGGQGGGFRDPSDPNYMTPSRPAPPPPGSGGQGGGGFRDPSDPNYMTPSRPAPAPPPPSDPAEPQEPGRPLGPGKDYRAKSRPKKVPEIGSMPGHYDAPDAPGEEAWLAAAEPPPAPRAAALDDPGADDPGAGDPGAHDPNVDKPFQM
ncbi:WXG100-like domain-containing protein [Nocardia africana]